MKVQRSFSVVRQNLYTSKKIKKQLVNVMNSFQILVLKQNIFLRDFIKRMISDIQKFAGHNSSFVLPLPVQSI